MKERLFIFAFATYVFWSFIQNFCNLIAWSNGDVH
ncbi:hypothetical protein LRU_00371 [Ligilactobacillus ruminis SPM0211]|uniref:Uncharacterized protein n=1 Tax=Ligilactobacillus ruminis SPM0211 TaxID=1040964 RepID=F7QY86_9LACO|nr:hypothetical protein LRU_00371 [Ligilactobacillus ruminis SPM0211]